MNQVSTRCLRTGNARYQFDIYVRLRWRAHEKCPRVCLLGMCAGPISVELISWNLCYTSRKLVRSHVKILAPRARTDRKGALVACRERWLLAVDIQSISSDLRGKRQQQQKTWRRNTRGKKNAMHLCAMCLFVQRVIPQRNEEYSSQFI